MFKLASQNFPQKITITSLVEFCFDKYLFSALLIYGLATLLWVYALKLAPLSVTYPFMALAFIIVPTLSFLVLNEPIDMRIALGTLLIVSGLLVIMK
ncbi:MAG: EamA family transporter [Gammaproteobacteria bacterium]